MRKKWLGILLACVLVTGTLGGCGSQAESGTENGTVKEEAAEGENDIIHLKYTTWSAGGEQTAVKQAIASFEAQNPDIKVETEFIDNANYTAKLNTLMAAGDAPNVAQLNGYLAPEYGGEGSASGLKAISGGAG